MASRRRRTAILALLGFTSGLPLLLTGQTLGAWLSSEGVDLAAIGAMALVGLPYSLKWAWAPLFDRVALPWLGRRRGWMLALTLALAAAIAALGGLDPRGAPLGFALAAGLVALLSASLDVVIDAYKADLLADDERVAGAAAAVTGYRLAMVVSGAVALGLADHVAWSTIYRALAALMLIGVVATVIADEPPATRPPATLAAAVWLPLRGLLVQERAAIALAFVALYRFGDHLAQVVVIPFLKDGAGFSFGAIATSYHLVGLAGTAAGGLLAARLARAWSMRRALLVFGALQAAANLGYLALIGRPSLGLLAAVVTLDNLANAMGAAAFVAFLMARCDRAVSATQLALLTSLSSLGGRLLGSAAGALAATAGWPTLWIATAAAALPALGLVALLPDRAPTRPEHAAP